MNSETSQAALESIDASALRQQIVDHYNTLADGATCDEVEISLGMSHQTCSARISELKESGQLAESGRTRPTRSGRQAAVLVLGETIRLHTPDPVHMTFNERREPSIVIAEADRLEAMRRLPSNFADALVTDAPYGLGKLPTPEQILVYLQGADLKTGDFMGADWEIPPVEFWKEAYRVLKPGAALLCFGGTRTFGLMEVGIRMARFEPRDALLAPCLAYVHGEGMPKGQRVDNEIFKRAIKCLSSENVSHVVQISKPFRVKLPEAKRDIVLASARIQPGGDPVLLMEIGKEDGSSAVMATLLSPSEVDNIVSNTTLSWNSTSVDDFNEMSTSTTKTESKTITDSKTLDFLRSLSTQKNTLNTEILPDGARWPAVAVGTSLIADDTNKNVIPVLTALGPAMWNPLAATAGFNVNLKPAWEPVLLFRKPLEGTCAENVLKWGCGALNIDGCRVATDWSTDPTRRGWQGGLGKAGTMEKWDSAKDAGPNSAGRFPPNVLLQHLPTCQPIGEVQIRGDQRLPQDGTRPGGFGDVGADNGDGKPCGPLYGNVVTTYNCAPNCPTAALDAQAGPKKSGKMRAGTKRKNRAGYAGPLPEATGAECQGDAGAVSRFFPTFTWSELDLFPLRYQAKPAKKEKNAGCDDLLWVRAGKDGWRSATQEEYGVASEADRRQGNIHTTVKSVELMRWLVRLVARPGARIIEPHSGSGTTAVACLLEGIDCIAFDNDPNSVAISKARVEHARKSR